jgi:hypothetical protein
MLRTLKIAKIIAAAAMICFIAYLAVSGMRPDEDTEAILAKQSAVSKFRKLSDLLKRAKDKESEFVKQAKKFALRINPPPPPEPVVTKRTGSRKPTVAKPVESKKPTPPKPTRTTKFSLVATCRYEDKPEKSLAQIDIVAEGKKWVRQGDLIGHLTIHEVKDGSIVLYQGDALNTEIFVPPVKEAKSLLKPAEETETIAESEQIVKEDAKIVFEAITNTPANKPKAISKKKPTISKPPAINRARALKPPVAVKPVVTKPVVTKPVAAKPVKKTPKRVPPKPPTPEEQRKVLDDNISAIENIMKENAGSSKEGDDAEMFKTLLKLLEEDKKRIDSTPSPKAPQDKEGKPAKENPPPPPPSKDKKATKPQG